MTILNRVARSGYSILLLSLLVIKMTRTVDSASLATSKQSHQDKFESLIQEASAALETFYETDTSGSTTENFKGVVAVTEDVKNLDTDTLSETPDLLGIGSGVPDLGPITTIDLDEWKKTTQENLSKLKKDELCNLKYTPIKDIQEIEDKMNKIRKEILSDLQKKNCATSSAGIIHHGLTLVCVLCFTLNYLWFHSLIT